MVSTGQFSLFLKKLFGFEKIDSFFFYCLVFCVEEFVSEEGEFWVFLFCLLSDFIGFLVFDLNTCDFRLFEFSYV
jgi:hypothetical protein